MTAPVPPPPGAPVVHYRRGQREPIECGLRPILVNDTPEGPRGNVTSHFIEVNCHNCRAVVYVSIALAQAHPCNDPAEHRATARARLRL